MHAVFEPWIPEWDFLSYDSPKGRRTQGSKALQYLEENKSIEMLLVKAIEHSIEQTESA